MLVLPSATSYPEYFVVPAFLKQYGLAEVIDFRSKGRLPALVWLDPTSGAAMLRCRLVGERVPFWVTLLPI